MPYGAEGDGKYGHQARRVMDDEAANAVIVAVVQGRQGSGFTVAVRGTPQLPVMRELAKALRQIAGAMDADTDSLERAKL